MNHKKSRYSKFQKRVFFTVSCLFILGLVWIIQYYQNKDEVTLSLYPNGKNFAFTITDDPDGNTLEKIKPVYDYLRQAGIKTTIAVWVFKGNRSNGIPDIPKNSYWVDTCEREDYLTYMKKLQKEGFEIALHGVSPGNDRRDRTISGYEKFREYFGAYPKMNIMHAQNLENVYWGKKIVSNRTAQFLIGLFSNKAIIPFSGEDPLSRYFWGDILQQKTKYVRLFGTSEINTLKFNPSMPYHDPEKPYVNYWFSFSDGFGIYGFNDLISRANVDKLVNERGTCIAYTHFAHGFVRDGKLDNTFKQKINYLVSQPDGWFVPASDLLDRMFLMKKVLLIKGHNQFMVVNLNDVGIEGVTVIVPSNRVWFNLDGKKYDINHEGEIIFDAIEAGGAVVLLANNSSTLNKGKRFTSKDNGMKVINFKDAVYIEKENREEFYRLFDQLTIEQPLLDVSGREVSLKKNFKYLGSDRTAKKGIVLFKNKNVIRPKKQQPGRWETLNMVFQRSLLYIKHKTGYRTFQN